MQSQGYPASHHRIAVLEVETFFLLDHSSFKSNEVCQKGANAEGYGKMEDCIIPTNETTASILIACLFHGASIL